MALLSGKDGTLYVGATQLVPVSNWKLSIASRGQSYVANDTAGWNRRVAGAKASAGSFEVKVADSGNAPVEPGDSVTLKLHVDDSGTNYYAVPAVVERLRIETDMDGKTPVAWHVEFSGDGAVTPYGALAVS